MKTTSILLASVIGFLASCKEAEKPQASAPAEDGTVKTVLSSSPKGEPLAIHSVRESSKAGDEVTIKGRIMGNATPFVEGRSAFILADPTILAACNDKPGDECETPWDSCCNSPDEKKKGIATIQIVGTDGRVLKEPLEGVSGLSKLATVTVTGTVAKGSSADLLIVNASAIHAGK